MRRNVTENLPVDIVLAPDWWYHNTGITFDEDFFYHPVRRVEVERRMEKELYDRFGRYGQGESHSEDRPEVGAVHLAAGFMVSEMLGCRVDYKEDAPPQVMPAGVSSPVFPAGNPFQSSAWKRFETMINSMHDRYGRLVGDVNWGGILNLALDLRGQELFLDMLDAPDQVLLFFKSIAEVLTDFAGRIAERTGSTSVSVNRLVRHRPRAVFLHSQCSHTMISEEDYRKYLMQYDIEWSRVRRPYGIHFCGSDPHRFAQAFAELPYLDFLDVGWGGDVAQLRRYLPETFLNIRLSPVELIKQSEDEIRSVIRRLVADSGDLSLTGLCCINMDRNVTDGKIKAILGTVEAIRKENVLCDS